MGEPTAPPRVEGELVIDGFRLYYVSFGPTSGAPTVLALHGGPGATLDYLLPLSDLVRWGYRVVLFDQLGCGRSEVPPGTAHYTMEHHLLEVEGVREGLGLGRVHLVGSSYGGLLAIAYALEHAAQLRSLTTVSGLASVPLTITEMRRLIAELPRSVRATIERSESSGATSSPEYQAAANEFYKRHLCRLDPWPAELRETIERMAAGPVYAYMNGPSEFDITGTIRSVDLSGKLGGIAVPTLVLGGRYDEVTPVVAEQIRSGIPGARGVTFEHSSHVAFWEERERFMNVLAGFLRSVDGA